MGACVMGFDTTSRAVGDTLEKEIKRVVQVVEAYPDTGRRVFQTVLTEFEKFLEHYFKNEDEATPPRRDRSRSRSNSRETLAIQYTIELRKMLNEVPVQEVREFLFHVWADVMAMTSVKFGVHSAETKTMKRVAADLIWSASAKVSREDARRGDPPPAAAAEDAARGHGPRRPRRPSKQDEHIQAPEQLAGGRASPPRPRPSRASGSRLMDRLETLEELLPDTEDMEIDESLVLDLSGHELVRTRGGGRGRLHAHAGHADLGA